MVNGAGDRMLDNVLEDAAISLEHTSSNQVCPDHDKLRGGIYALILCERDRREEAKRIKEEHKAEEQVKRNRNAATVTNFLSLSKKDGIKAAGVPACIVAAVIAMVLLQWWQSSKLEETARMIAKQAVTSALSEAQ